MRELAVANASESTAFYMKILVQVARLWSGLRNAFASYNTLDLFAMLSLTLSLTAYLYLYLCYSATAVSD